MDEVVVYGGVSGTTISYVRSRNTPGVTIETSNVVRPPGQRPTMASLRAQRDTIAIPPLRSDYLYKSPIGYHVTSFGPFFSSGMQENPNLSRGDGGSDEDLLQSYNETCDFDRVCPACRVWYFVGENVLVGRPVEFSAFYRRNAPQNGQVTTEVRTIQETTFACSPICERVIRDRKHPWKIKRMCDEATKGQCGFIRNHLRGKTPCIKLPDYGDIIVRPARCQQEKEMHLKVIFEGNVRLASGSSPTSSESGDRQSRDEQDTASDSAGVSETIGTSDFEGFIGQDRQGSVSQDTSRTFELDPPPNDSKEDGTLAGGLPATHLSGRQASHGKASLLGQNTHMLSSETGGEVGRK